MSVKSLKRNPLIALGGLLITIATSFVVFGGSPTGAETPDKDTETAIPPSRRTVDTPVRNSVQEKRADRFQEIIQQDTDVIGAEITRIFEIKDLVQRSQEWLDFLKSVEPSQWDGVVTAFRAININGSGNEYAMLLGQWTNVDPFAALAYVKENIEQGELEEGIILDRWADEDLYGALSWVKASGDGEQLLAQRLVSLANRVGTSDLAQTTDILEAIPPLQYDTQLRKGLQSVMPKILALGSDEARGWLEALPDGRLRSQALAQLVSLQVRKEPEDTLNWLAGLNETERIRGTSSAFSSLARSDPANAVKFAEEQPAGAVRRTAFDRTLSMATAVNSDYAASIIRPYLNEFSDYQVASSVDLIAQRRPAVAAQFLGEIQGVEQRAKVFSRISETWQRTNNEAFEAWLADNPNYRDL